MDSLTQIVLGAAVGNQTLGNKIGNRAVFYGAIAGTIPDLDVFVGKLFDPITAIELHRGFSHSVLFFVLLSPILGWGLYAKEKTYGVSYYKAVSLWFWGLLTHALLDAFTTWGTQLFWPLDYRVAFHSIFVIDPLYTIPFLICLVLSMRWSATHYKRLLWNRRGLIISSAYLLFTLAVKLGVYEKFKESLAKNEIVYTDIIVKPAPFTITLWNVHVKTERGYWISDYSFFDTQPIDWVYYPETVYLPEPFAQSEIVERLIKISEGWYIISEKDGNYYFNDMRFGMMDTDPENPLWAFSYFLTETEKGLYAEEMPNRTREQGKKMLNLLFRRIQGN